MPHGNVGTPTKVFHSLIAACKLPPAIVKLVSNALICVLTTDLKSLISNSQEVEKDDLVLSITTTVDRECLNTALRTRP